MTKIAIRVVAVVAGAASLFAAGPSVADGPQFQLQLKGTNRCLRAMQTTDPATAVPVTVIKTDTCQATPEFLADAGTNSARFIRFKISPQTFRCLHVTLPANPHDIRTPIRVDTNDCGAGLNFWSIAADRVILRDEAHDNANLAAVCLEEGPAGDVLLNICGEGGVPAQSFEQAFP